MIKKFLFVFLILVFILLCYSVHASEYIDTVLPGKWNIYGTSFVEKDFVRISFKAEGEMNLLTDVLKNLNASLDTIIDNNQKVSRNVINENRKVLTSCDINLKLYIFDKAGFDIRVWDDYIDNAIGIPVLLPEARPTINNPFVLPTVRLQDLNLTVTFTSESSGKLRVKGYADLDTVGVCEINADCALWKDGTERPSLEKETSSGCNATGLGILVLFIALRLLVIFERGRKFCSERI